MELREIEAHNLAVARLWDGFRAGANDRVPITFGTDEYVWLNLTGNTFREFYTDPRVQLEVQLAGQAWFAETVVHDQRLGPPAECWTVVPRFWMDECEGLGCGIVIQEDDFAWEKPVQAEKEDLLRRLADLDPREMVLGSRLWGLYEAMRDLADGMTYRELPVRIYFPGGGTHGLFTVTCQVRGAQQLCLDLKEDPDFAYELLGLVAEKTLGRIRAWHELARTGTDLPMSGMWGMADDALQLISAETYRRLVLPHHERMYSAMTTGDRHMHLCGYAQQHFETLYHELGIVSLEGPGTFVDHGALLEAMPRLRLGAQCDHSVLMLGPEAAIARMMRAMLSDTARKPGRFSISGFLVRQTPLAHVRAMYEAGKRYGAIADEAKAP